MTYSPPKTAEVVTETFLTPQEVFDLTGFKTPRKQCEQLRKIAIPFFTNARGYPRVHRNSIDPTQSKSKVQQTQPAWQPKVPIP